MPYYVALLATIMTETHRVWILTALDINVAAAAGSESHNTDVSSRVLHGNLQDDQLLNPVSLQQRRPHSEWCYESLKHSKKVYFSSVIIKYN